MNIKEFSYYVEEHIRDYLPEEIQETADIYVHPGRKNNDTLQYQLSIRQEGEKIHPLMSLEAAWEAYQNGVEMETVLENLVESYGEHRRDFQGEIPLEYEAVKDWVIFQIINKESNRASLKERIYTDAGHGFAKVYAIHQKLDGIPEEGNIPITNSLMQGYGYDMQEIVQKAEENTPQIYPAVFTSIAQMLSELRPEEAVDEKLDVGTLFVLSNTDGYRGAGALFYPGAQKKIAETLGQSYYVMPSSVHEMLIMPGSTGILPAELEQMVRSVNGEAVSRADFLSNKVLFYDREKEQLRTALPEIPDLQTEKKGMER